MTSVAASSPSASDGSSSAGRAWNRPSGGRFEWVASSPSSAEIAELERLFPEIIQVPVQALEDEVSGWENSSIIARSLGRWVPPEAIVREFHRSGIAGEIAAFSLAHRHYIFRFADSHAKDLVLGRPLVVNGQLIATMDWQSEFVTSAVSLLSALVWIRLPLLPMEFWHEEILSKILSVAGEFCFADDATRLKSRGGFARACVHVDLGKPLRPGARVRGTRSPFWQQFSFESLDGICVSCGAVHFDGCCDPVAMTDASSVGPRFGPWMAAIRHRRPTQVQPPGPSPSALREGHSSSAAKEGWQSPKSIVDRSGPASSPVSKDGWTVPKKLARCQRPPSSASLMLLPGQGAGRGESVGFESSELLSRESCMQSQAVGKALVPVPIILGQGLQDDPRRHMSMPVGTVTPFQLATKEGVQTISPGSECFLS